MQVHKAPAVFQEIVIVVAGGLPQKEILRHGKIVSISHHPAVLDSQRGKHVYDLLII